MRQPTPRMQVIALVSGAQGLLLNIEHKDSKNPIVDAAQAEGRLREAQNILATMPEGRWRKGSGRG